MVPATSEKRPPTFDTIRWRTAKPTSLWLASSPYVPAAGTSVPSTVRTAGLAGAVVRLMGVSSVPVIFEHAIVVDTSNVPPNSCACKYYSGYRGRRDEPRTRRRPSDRRGAVLRDRGRARSGAGAPPRQLRAAPRLARGAGAGGPLAPRSAADGRP